MKYINKLNYKFTLIIIVLLFILYNICNTHLFSYMKASYNLKENPQDIHVLFYINDNYAKFLSVTMLSILSNTQERLHFHILHNGISPKNKNKLISIKNIHSFSLEFIYVNDKRISSIIKSLTSQVHNISYYRLLASSIKSNLDKCILSDVDLVFISDIAELWNINIEDKYLAAVPDPTRKSLEFRWIDKLNLPKNYVYFNSGILSANLKKWREDNIERKIFENNNKYFLKLGYPDQDLLNITMKDKIKYLNPKFNAMPILKYHDINEKKMAFDNPVVIHWAGMYKPWNTRQIEKKELFWKYAELSPFYFEILVDYYINSIKSIGKKFPDYK